MREAGDYACIYLDVKVHVVVRLREALCPLFGNVVNGQPPDTGYVKDLDNNLNMLSVHVYLRLSARDLALINAVWPEVHRNYVLHQQP